MKKCAVVIVLLLAGCTPVPIEQMPADSRPSRTPPPTATPYVTAEPTVPVEDPDALPVVRGEFFATSGVCAECHTGSMSEAGEDISTDTQWRASLMALSARDPYFQAELARMAGLPGALTAEVEALCSDCHAPMAAYTARQSGSQPSLLGDGAFSEAHPDHELAMDGVSCSMCHQVTEEDLGFPRSYSGGYRIEAEAPAQGRPAFGSFDPSAEHRAVMQAASGFVPEKTQHLQRSEYCATCHTVYTPVVSEDGPTGELFPAQTPYFEWYYSGYRNTVSCQDCHMPDAEGTARLTNLETPLRIPFAQHRFSGSNTYILGLIDRYQDELGVNASLQDFRRAYEAVTFQLQNDTAAVSLEESSIVDTWMRLDLLVENLAGHKLPTAFSSRRMWIHLRVTDAAGELVFESGGYDEFGRIFGDAFDEGGDSFEPHYDRITSGDEVQIYETIPADISGAVTTDMLRAASRLKDNRLLPAGFSMNRTYPDFTMYGEAAEDDDFLGGEDRIRYLFDTRGYSEPFTVHAELLFQQVGYRWAAAVQGGEAEVERFQLYVESVPPLPERIAGFEEDVVKGD